MLSGCHTEETVLVLAKMSNKRTLVKLANKFFFLNSILEAIDIFFFLFSCRTPNSDIVLKNKQHDTRKSQRGPSLPYFTFVKEKEGNGLATKTHKIYFLCGVPFLSFLQFITAKMQTDLQNKWFDSIQRDREHWDITKSINN